jgi:hypothetical protein
VSRSAEAVESCEKFRRRPLNPTGLFLLKHRENALFGR